VRISPARGPAPRHTSVRVLSAVMLRHTLSRAWRATERVAAASPRVTARGACRARISRIPREWDLARHPSRPGIHSSAEAKPRRVEARDLTSTDVPSALAPLTFLHRHRMRRVPPSARAPRPAPRPRAASPLLRSVVRRAERPREASRALARSQPRVSAGEGRAALRVRRGGRLGGEPERVPQGARARRPAQRVRAAAHAATRRRRRGGRVRGIRRVARICVPIARPRS
jgi:hypothetical protein